MHWKLTSKVSPKIASFTVHQVSDEARFENTFESVKTFAPNIIDIL